MKPFDLERALAGEPIICRNGHIPEEWHYFESASNNVHPIKFVISGNLYGVDKNGRLYPSCESELDLCMVSPKRLGWVNIYRGAICKGVFDTELEALQHNLDHHAPGERVACIKVEWEE